MPPSDLSPSPSSAPSPACDPSSAPESSPASTNEPAPVPLPARHHRNLRTLFFQVLLAWALPGMLGAMALEVASSLSTPAAPVTEADVGRVGAWFWIVVAASTLAWGVLEAFFSRKRLLLAAALLWTASTLLLGGVRTYAGLFTFQMTGAVGYAAILPVSYAFLTDLIPRGARGKAFGLLATANALGVGFGALLAGILVDYLPWNVPFLVLGCLACISCGFVTRLEEPGRGAAERHLPDAGSRQDPSSARPAEGDGTAAPVGPSGSQFRWRDLGRIFRNRTNALVSLYLVVQEIAVGTLGFWILPLLKHDHGFTSTTATFLQLAIFGAQPLGGIFWGRRADRKFAERPDGKGRVVLEELALGAPLLILGYSLAFGPTDVGLLLLFAACVGTGSFMIAFTGSLAYAVLGDVNPPELRGSLFAVNNLLQVASRSLGIWLTGLLFTALGEFRPGFVLVGVLYLATIPIFYPVTRAIPRELERLDEQFLTPGPASNPGRGVLDRG